MYDHFSVVEHDDEQKLFSSWVQGMVGGFHIIFPFKQDNLRSVVFGIRTSHRF